MKRASLIGSTAAGFVLGALIMNAIPASAQLAVADAQAAYDRIIQIGKESGILGAANAISSVVSDVNKGIDKFNNALGLNTYGDTNTLLRQGFTQNANYSKAQIGASEQLADATNTAMARFNRDMRNAQIRDEHTANPEQCIALDGGVSTQSANVQAFGVAQTIAAIQDARGEAAAGMPSHFGQAGGVASMSALHLSQYCNADDAAANLCTQSATPDADQRASSLFGPGLLEDQTAVNAAKDFIVNLTQPVAPAALRGDQLASVNGQDAAVWRRGYNARISLSQGVAIEALAVQAASVPLTQTQTQYMMNMGLRPPASGKGSWLQTLQIEAQRRVSDVGWHAALQKMQPASVEREIALELALNNYLLFETFKMNMQHTTIAATQLAEQTERNFVPTTRISTPNIQ